MLLERFVTRQVIGHVKSNNQLPDRKSSWRFGFPPPEIAVWCILSVILDIVDGGDVTILALFDVSASLRYYADAYISHTVFIALCVIVRIIFQQSKTIGTTRLKSICFYHGLLWYYSRIGSWNNTLYKCTRQIWWGLLSAMTVTASLCWWYASLWSLFAQYNGLPFNQCLGVHRWNSTLDAVKQTNKQTPTHVNKTELIWCATPRSLPLPPG